MPNAICKKNAFPPMPLENWFQILSKVDVTKHKNCLRVCKLWYAYFTSPQFQRLLVDKFQAGDRHLDEAFVRRLVPMLRWKEVSMSCHVVTRKIFEGSIVASAIDESYTYWMTYSEHANHLHRMKHGQTNYQTFYIGTQLGVTSQIRDFQVHKETFWFCFESKIGRFLLGENITDFHTFEFVGTKVRKIQPMDDDHIVIWTQVSNNFDTYISIYSCVQNSVVRDFRLPKDALDICYANNHVWSLHNDLPDYQIVELPKTILYKSSVWNNVRESTTFRNASLKQFVKADANTLICMGKHSCVVVDVQKDLNMCRILKKESSFTIFGKKIRLPNVCSSRIVAAGIAYGRLFVETKQRTIVYNSENLSKQSEFKKRGLTLLSKEGGKMLVFQNELMHYFLTQNAMYVQFLTNTISEK